MGELTTLFDTSVVTDSVAGPAPVAGGDAAVSVVTVGELHAGVLLAADRDLQMLRLGRLATVLADVTVLDIDRSVATAYGELRMACRAPSNDLWIAATARAHGLELVTADARQAALPGVRATLIATDRRPQA